MSRIVRYRPLDDLGEVRLDLDECPRRFVLFEQDPEHPDYPLEGPLIIALFLTPDGRWVQYTEQLSDYVSRPNVIDLIEVTPAYVIQELGLSMRELPPDLAALEPYRRAMRQSEAWGYMPRAGIEPAPLPEAPAACSVADAANNELTAYILGLEQGARDRQAPTNGRAPEESGIAATNRRTSEPRGGPPVILGKPGDETIVRGKRKGRLTLPRYNVVEALLAASDDGLSKDSLARESGHSDAVNILKRLAESDTDWKAVIKLAGKPGGRYRISD